MQENLAEGGTPVSKLLEEQKGKESEDDDEEKTRAIKKKKQQQKDSMNDEEEKKATVKVQKVGVVDDEEGSDEEVTRKNKKKTITKDEPIVTLSLKSADLSKQSTAQKADLLLIQDSRLLSKEFMEQFSTTPIDKVLTLATKNQVVRMVEARTILDYDSTKNLMEYIKTKGHNFNEVYSLQFLAKGGQSQVLRAELLQPVEVVIKMSLPGSSGSAANEAFLEMLEESHMIKMLDNSEYIVDVYEEIIEFNKNTNQIENYLVVIEQAINDLTNIVSFWVDEEKKFTETEFFSNEKLLYFFLKTLETIEYCHSQNVYYGDIKPQNFLIFRDYSVKLGDFGVSFRMKDDEDPDDKIYQLKGCTVKFVMPSILADTGADFSKIDLINNDYYALYVTFDIIYNQIKALKGVDYSLEEDVCKEYGFNEDSTFCHLLQELKTLRYPKQTLGDFLKKQKELLRNDNLYLKNLTDQLIYDDKIQAIPNILSFWSYRDVSNLVKEYFLQRQNEEYPFLQNKQFKQIEEDSKNQEKQPLKRDDVIKRIQNRILENGGLNKNFNEIFVNLMHYSLNLQPEEYGLFYQDIVKSFFDHNVEGNFINCFDFLEYEEEKLNQVLSQSEELKAKFKDCILFYSIIASYFNSFSVQNIQKCFLLSVNGEASCLHYFKLYQNILRGKISLEKKELMETYFSLLDEADDDVTENIYEISKIMSQIIYQKGSGAIASIFQKVEFLKPKSSSLDRKFSYLNQTLEVLQRQVVDLNSGYYPSELNYLQLARKIGKKIYGELGNFMSQNAFLIYLQIKQKFKITASQEDYDLSQKYLLKACNYSLKDEQGLYLCALVEELLKQNLANDAMTILKRYKQNGQNELYIILKNYFFKKQKPAAKLQIISQYSNQNNFITLVKYLQASQIKLAFIELFNLPNELYTAKEEFLFYFWQKQLAIEKVKQQISQQPDQLNYSHLTIVSGNLGSLEGEYVVKFPDERSFTLNFLQGELNGPLKYAGISGEFGQENYQSGKLIGECEIIGKFYSLKGTYLEEGGIGEFELTNKMGTETYKGAMRNFCYHGQGEYKIVALDQGEDSCWNIYIGEWNFGQRTKGELTVQFGNKKYIYEVNNGQMHGSIKYFCDDTLTSEGEIKLGVLQYLENQYVKSFYDENYKLSKQFVYFHKEEGKKIKNLEFFSNDIIFIRFGKKHSSDNQFRFQGYFEECNEKVRELGPKNWDENILNYEDAAVKKLSFFEIGTKHGFDSYYDIETNKVVFIKENIQYPDEDYKFHRDCPVQLRRWTQEQRIQKDSDKKTFECHDCEQTYSGDGFCDADLEITLCLTCEMGRRKLLHTSYQIIE